MSKHMSEYSVGGVNRDMVGFYPLAEERAEKWTWGIGGVGGRGG